MHTEAYDALVNLKKYIREYSGEPIGRIACIQLIDEFMKKAVHTTSATKKRKIQITKSELLLRLQVLTRAIYDTPGGGCGCCLHIVLDDGNFERSYVEWCLRRAKHGICREVAQLLLHLTEEGRETALGVGFLNFAGVKESQVILEEPDVD